MSVRGNLSKAPKSSKKFIEEPLQRVPYKKPLFTIRSLKKAIPHYCFDRSILHSLFFLIYDLMFIFIFYYLASNYIDILPHNLSYVAWPIYWIFQGLVLSGVWVIAHECGHNAFSNYQWIDDTIGFLIHSSLLVPYFSWKYSHRRHHSNINSLKHDEFFVPKLRSSLSSFVIYLNNPIGRVFHLMFNFALAFPLHLMFNYCGRNYDRFACHFDPNSPIYSKNERAQIIISDVGILVVSYGIYHLTMNNGLTWVICIYGVPLVIVNGLYICVTYLQHTHPSLPHYDSTEWDWLRGALATVDRDYGFLNKIGHNIANTHVTHHLFPKIPHYHAMEATKAIKPILKDYYKFDETPILKALYRESKECLYVKSDDNEDTKGVFWFSNKL